MFSPIELIDSCRHSRSRINCFFTNAQRMGPMNEHKPFGRLFLSAGAMKAGTTWLYAVLNHHPELHFTLEKELHYFYHIYVKDDTLNDASRMQRAQKYHGRIFSPKNASLNQLSLNFLWVSNFLNGEVDDSWYQKLFASAWPGKVCSQNSTYNLWFKNLLAKRPRDLYGCDFSNLYALLPSDAWRKIEAKSDKLRVLYTLRHPIGRLWSHVKFYMQINRKIDDIKEWGPNEFRSLARKTYIWENAEYGAAIRKMKAGLSNGALKVIFFEDLHDDKLGTLAEIEDFLGINRQKYPQQFLERKINETASIQMPDFFPELFSQEMRRIFEEVEAEGLILPKSWRN